MAVLLCSALCVPADFRFNTRRELIVPKRVSLSLSLSLHRFLPFVLSGHDEKEGFKVSVFFCTAVTRALCRHLALYASFRGHTSSPVSYYACYYSALFERGHCWESQCFNHFLSYIHMHVRMKSYSDQVILEIVTKEVSKAAFVWIFKNDLSERYGRKSILVSPR